MSNNPTYEHNARRISDLRDRLAVLKQRFADLELQRDQYSAANDFLGLLEREVMHSNLKNAWLEFLENIDLRERYETTVGYANRNFSTTDY